METLNKTEDPKKLLAAFESSDDFEFAWDDFIEEVKTIMAKAKIKKWFAYGLELTWRNVPGFTEFETERAQTLIDKLTPNSDFSINIYKEGRNDFKVVIWHHDKPMGETMYLMSQDREKKLGIKDKYFSK
jgi:hypothetical protein